MKLFVWQDVLCDWTCGVMFALAETKEQAMEQLIAGSKSISEDDFTKEPTVHDVNKPFALGVWGGG